MTAQLPGDDGLRAMLEVRADRVVEADAREVLAAARARIAGPAAGASGQAFGVQRVRVVRRVARVPWRLAVLGFAAVVAGVVLGSRLDLGLQGPPGAVASLAVGDVASASPGRSAAPSPTSAPTPAPVATVRWDELPSALNRGTLDGKLVVVEGRLSLVRGRCAAGGSGDCAWVQLEGLDNERIDLGVLSPNEAAVAIARHPTDSPIALLVKDRAVSLVGWLVAGVPDPVDVGWLMPVERALPAGDVAVVDGWVIGPQARWACPATQATTCPGERPWLTETAPLPDGTALHGTVGLEVDVVSTLGLQDAPHEIAGPFLVRSPAPGTGSGARFEIGGLYSDVALVDRTPGGTLGSADVMAALRDGSLDGRILVLGAELKTVAWACPSGVPEPCTRFYVDGLPGVALTYDGWMNVSPDASGGGTGAPPMTGTLLVVPRSGHLELLGRLTGTLDRPQPVGDALQDGLPSIADDPMELDAVAGWLVTRGGRFCPIAEPGGAACFLGPLLTDREPTAAGLVPGNVREPVLVHEGAPGIDPESIVTEGPFLLRGASGSADCPEPASCAGPRVWTWSVVARYDPAQVLVVSLG